MKLTRNCLNTMLFISISSAAAGVEAGNWGVNVLAGAASLDLDKQNQVVFPALSFRTDSFTVENNHFNFSPAIGLLYRIPADSGKNGNAHYLHDLTFGINFYYAEGRKSGSVYEYSLSNFNNSTYDMKLKNYRLMLDMEWTFQPAFWELMPFVEAGVGGARNTMRFTNIPRPNIGANGGNYLLPNHATKVFAYEFGAGLKRNIGEHMVASARYIYSDASHVNSTRLDPVTGVRLASPISSDLHSQAVFLGFSYFCG